MTDRTDLEDAANRLAADESVPREERVRRIAEMLSIEHRFAARLVAASMGELGTHVTDNGDGTVTIRTIG